MTTTTTAPELVQTPELVSLWHQAQAMAASGKYEHAYTPEEAFARILAGRDLGLTASDSMVHMHWLDGHFEPSTEIQGALLKAYVGPDGERYDYRAIREETQCLVTILRKESGGAWGEIGDVTYTLEDARRAEILDSSDFWRKHPRRMLFWRALSEAIEAFAPHVVHPVHLPPRIEPPLSAEQLDDVDLPRPAGNPAEISRGGIAAHPETAAAWLKNFQRFVDRAEKSGSTRRIVEALDAVGAPAGDSLLNRFAQLPDGNAAHEVIHRLDFHRNRPRRLDTDGNTSDSPQGGTPA